MAENPKMGQRGRALDALTTQYLKEELQQEALTLTVNQYSEALVSESLTTSHIKANLASAAKNQPQAQTQQHAEAKSSEKSQSQ
jgi:hypothetical protein